MEISDVKEFIDGKRKKNTMQATNRDVTNVHRWLLESKMELRSITEIPSLELNAYISMYLISVRKQDGTEYEPSTLTSMLYSFDR